MWNRFFERNPRAIRRHLSFVKIAVAERGDLTPIPLRKTGYLFFAKIPPEGRRLDIDGGFWYNK